VAAVPPLPSVVVSGGGSSSGGSIPFGFALDPCVGRGLRVSFSRSRRYFVCCWVVFVVVVAVVVAERASGSGGAELAFGGGLNVDT
jgi:hypothetical protein